MNPYRLFKSLAVVIPFAVAALTDARAQSFALPADARVANVRDYGAIGDGVADDTAAIQAAINSTGTTSDRLVYLPNGAYKVSNTIAWERRKILHGESRDGVIIKLTDNNSAFNATNAPNGKCVIDTLGGGNDAFRNGIYNLTVDIGTGNPKAIGVRYNASNQGSLYNVRIISSDPQRLGLYGLYTDGSPMLIKKVTVEGFDSGVYARGRGTSFEDITVINQRVRGIWANYGSTFWRRVESQNSVPAFQLLTGSVFVTLIDANFTGGAANQVAITNDNGMPLFVRNLTTSGYGNAMRNIFNSVTTTTPGPSVAEFSSSTPLSLFPSPAKTLGLPVEETPIPASYAPPSDWANVESFGANGTDGNDDTNAIQAAIDSGKSTVYFPNGDYYIRDTIIIRGNVSHIIGLESTINAIESGFVGTEKPLFRFANGTASSVLMERFWNGYGFRPVVFMEHASNRTLVLRSAWVFGYRNTAGGKLFIEDVTGDELTVTAPQKAWMRQVNPESKTGTLFNLKNNGADVWIFGVKTEGSKTVLETTNGGRSEVLGGTMASTRGGGISGMFVNRDSSLSLVTCNAKGFGGDIDVFHWPVEETRDGAARKLRYEDTAFWSGSGGGRAITLYTGYKDPANPPAPTVVPVRILPAGGTFSESVFVSLSCDTAGATIRYTTDGSVPTAASPVYTRPFPVSVNTTVKAIASRSGLADATPASASYVVTDTTSPQITSVVAVGGSSSVEVTFSERLQAGSLTAGQFSLNSGQTVTNIALDPERYVATLTLNVPMPVAQKSVLTATGLTSASNGLTTASANLSFDVYPINPNDLNLWLRADDLPAGVSPVATWRDASGRGNSLTQATTTKQPTLVASGLNALPAVNFDGVDDSLERLLATEYGGVSTVFLVSTPVTIPATGNARVIFSTGLRDPQTGALQVTVNNKAKYQFSGYFDYPNYPAAIGQGSLTTLRVNDNALEVFENGVQQSTIVPKWSDEFKNVSNYVLGRGRSTVLPGASRVSELLVFHRALTNPERQQVEAYLNAKYALVDGLPVITVSTPTPTLAESGPLTGSFRISRSGSTSAALPIQVRMDGWARNGVDYTTVPSTATIPAGSTFVDVPITVIDDNNPEDTDRIILTVIADPGYRVGEPNSPGINILDNDVPAADLQIPVSADTSVDTANATANNGSLAFIGYGKFATNTRESFTYLRFNVAQLAGKNIESATLFLSYRNVSSKGNLFVNTPANFVTEVRSVADDSWAENLPYASRPAAGNVLGLLADIRSTSPPVTSFGYVNITSGVQAEANGDGVLSVRLGVQMPDDGIPANLFTKESDKGAVLLIKFAPEIIAAADSANVNSGQSVAINVLANDSDVTAGPQALSLAAVSTPANGAASISGNQVVYTSNTGFVGTDTFNYTVTDGLNSQQGVVSVSVSAGMNPLQTWRQTNFGTTANSGNAANVADPDFDGIQNLLEYATGTDPNQITTAPVTATNVVNDRLTLTFTRINDSSLTYRVQVSNNLVDGWTEIWSSSNNPGSGTTTVTDTQTTSAQSRRFLRLQVTQ